MPSPVLDDEQIASFFALEEVQKAKSQIDARSSPSASVYFTVGMTDTIRAVLKESFDLDLLDAKSVPMRWIKGDIAPHVDVGFGAAVAFDTTYLLYLTDSPGQLMLGGTSYPITKGTAYTFSESIRHETINTGFEPRLLLGPMSEEGFAVGAAPTPPEPDPEPIVVPCCARPTFRRGPLIDNTTYIDLVAGNTYVGSVRRNGVNISYAQMMAMKKAQASKTH
jgi:hypothetical protein